MKVKVYRPPKICKICESKGITTFIPSSYFAFIHIKEHLEKGGVPKA